MDTPQISFELARLGSRGPGIPFSDADSFSDALRSFGGEAMLVEVTLPEEDDAAEFDDGMQREAIGMIARGQGWNTALEHVRRSKEWIYLHGDCWHMALALHRMYGLDIVAVESGRPAGVDGAANPDDRKTVVDHVAAVLPDGRYLDIRGFLDGDEAMCRGMSGWENHAVRPSSRQEVIGILDAYAVTSGCEPFPWDDPAEYAFAGQTEILIRFLFEEEIEAVLSAHARFP